MKHSPGRSGILAVEYRLAQDRRALRESFAQVGSAIRLRLAQSSSLLIAAGAGGLLGIWFARQRKHRLKPDVVSVRASIVDPVSILLVRFGMQQLAGTWMRLRDAVVK